jgi:hypothetical protein
MANGGKPPKATPRRPQSHHKAIYCGVQSHPKATPRRPQGSTKAPPRLHQGSTKAPPKPHQGSTKAPPRLHQGSTKATPRLLGPVHVKPEIRRPKAERNPKSEGPKTQLAQRRGGPLDQAILAFRVSAFFRVSGFGLRVSAPRALFSLQPAALRSPALSVAGAKSFCFELRDH